MNKFNFRLFKAQSYNQPIYKHKDLPVYKTKEFDFFRCVEFNDCLYNVLATNLFNDNLRKSSGRYAALFPNEKISYWADSPKTAMAEVKKHGASNNLLTFWAYDDSSSFIPCMGNDEMLCIADGRKNGLQALIEKIDNGESLSPAESEKFKRVLKEKIDCISYDSKAYPGGENYIFLERGFKKLALRQIRLRFGRKNGGNHNIISCAFSSDYNPSPREYGKYFLPKCRIKRDLNYENSSECIERKSNIEAVKKRKFSGKK